MERKEQALTHFKFSFGHLKQLADRTLQLIDRDITQFTDRGFNAAKRTALVTAINDFANFSTDDQMLSIQTGVTDTKKANRDALEKHMRTTLLAARNVFGESSSMYKEFGPADVTSQTDANLVRNARAMSTTATKYLTPLATEGITAAKITAMDTARNAFDSSIDLQDQAITNRDNGTEQRAMLANNLYALIVKYSETGKDIWVAVSESKYNDYIIFDTPTADTPTPAEHTNPTV